MATLVETHREEPAPVCGHSGCQRPATVTTVLVSQSGRHWQLHHCEEHRDGPAIAEALGFRVVEP